MGLQVIVKHNSFKFLCIRGVCFYIPNFLFFLCFSLFKTILKKCLFILLVFSNNQCLDLVIISVLFIYLATQSTYSVLRIALSTLQILTLSILYNNPMRYYYYPHFIGKETEALGHFGFL